MGLLKEALSESGETSSTRLIMVMFFFVLVLAWLVVSIKGWTLAEIPASVVTVAGLLLGTKLGQKFTEGGGSLTLPPKQ